MIVLILGLVLASGARDEAAIVLRISAAPCRMAMNEQVIDSASLENYLATRDDADTPVLIEAEFETPWRCVGGPVFILQSAGFRNIQYRSPAEAEPDHPEVRPFDEDRAALADVAWALARAAISRRRVILVMGANWCHDSRGLAGWFETPRFAEMLDQRYELVYVDVGHPQEGKGRNIDIAQRFGIEEIVGTPTLLVLSPEGALLNAETAPDWRNAASRSVDEIFEYFAAFEPD